MVLFEDSDLAMILLGIGSIVGSIIFSVSNYFIENQGGFLRKMALKYKFLHREQKKRESHRQSVRGSTRLPRSSVKGTSPAGRAMPLPSKRTITDLSASIESDIPQRNSPADRIPIRVDTSSEEEEEEEESDELLTAADEKQPLVANPQLPIQDDSDFLSSKEEKALIEQEFLAHAKEGNVGLAIWMGILIDAFPESLVIGLLARNGISFTFIVGVFISNLPEALSSTVIMSRSGFSKTKILFMWSSITLITGLGAMLGVLLFEGEHTVGKEIAEKFVEGVAAGAMLVMIAETALPEAFRHAGHIVGFSTLFGFLMAYYIKLIEKII